MILFPAKWVKGRSVRIDWFVSLWERGNSCCGGATGEAIGVALWEWSGNLKIKKTEWCGNAKRKERYNKHDDHGSGFCTFSFFFLLHKTIAATTATITTMTMTMIAMRMTVGCSTGLCYCIRWQIQIACTALSDPPWRRDHTVVYCSHHFARFQSSPLR